MSTDTTNPTLTPKQKLKLLIADRPWETEPNHAEWVDEDTGYKCRIMRHDHFGQLCGYVGIPKNHPLYGKHYSDDEVENLDAHGGLTHSSTDTDDKDTWWFGFDCSHGGDLRPYMLVHLIGNGHTYTPDKGSDVYRTWEYVEREVRELSRQLKQAERN